MLLQLGEAVVLGALSTLIATVFSFFSDYYQRIHKVPHRSLRYYLISTSTIMVPNIIGLFWSRRKHLLSICSWSFI